MKAGITYTATVDRTDLDAVDSVKRYAVQGALAGNGCSTCCASISPDDGLIVSEWLGSRVINISILCARCAKPYHGARAS